MTINKKIRMGMIGGGEGSFIGKVHRHAAALDGNIELVCGTFSSKPQRSIDSGKAMSLPEERCYPDINTMLTKEAALPADERMQFVAIVTPNHLHFPAAKQSLLAGFHVMSDKPATMSLNEALELEKIVEQTGLLYGLTHTYLGYPLVQRAKELVDTKQIGTVRKVIAEYTQGWLSSADDEGSKQASWRLDPKQAGVSCCMGDIGVHAANLVEFITGEHITELSADLGSVVEGRVLDDDGSVLLRLANNARGTLMASQIAIGEENNLSIRVYGDKASLHWRQEEPNSLTIKYGDRSMVTERVGYAGIGAEHLTRLPSGHPEGYIEAFANIYQSFVGQIRAFESGNKPSDDIFMPGIKEAIRGMAFIENVVAADRSDKKWHTVVTTHSPL